MGLQRFTVGFHDINMFRRRADQIGRRHLNPSHMGGGSTKIV